MNESIKSKISDSIKGHLKVNNGKINKYVLPDVFDEYINNGWNKGFIKIKKTDE